MILGIGNDLCDIRRIQDSLTRFGDRFVNRVFTPVEREAAASRPESVRAAFYAKRFAAKEACAKALGTGIADGVYLTHIGVESRANGQPFLVLSGQARERLAAMAPPGMEAVAHLTLSDEPPLAQAIVIISARPLGASA